MARQSHTTPEERAAKRVKDRVDAMWHVASFVIINVFLWLIIPQAAFWITIGWGIGLSFHLAHYFITETGSQDRHYRQYLAEERAREEQDQH